MSTRVPGVDYETLACAPTYAHAHHIVDQLSEADFPIENVRIIGLGLTSIEHITGRVTLRRTLVQNSSAGAWAGMVAGLFICILQPVVLWRALVTGISLGFIGGLILGVASFYSRRSGQYTTLTSTQATSYEVQVIVGLADHARDILRLPSVATPASTTPINPQN